MFHAQQTQIGLMADLHYDGRAAAMNRLYEAVAELNIATVDALVVMGDLVDADSERGALRLLREVSALCESFRGPLHYMPGNHDLDHISKAQFYTALDRTGHPPRFRFALEGVEVVCVDCNFRPDGVEYEKGNFEWPEAHVPPEELAWLEDQLARVDGPALIVTHQRIDGAETHGVDNHAAVRAVIRSSGKVKAVFQGHRHADDLRQIDGTAYYTLGALLADAGPAVVLPGARGIRLVRDFRAGEGVGAT